MTPEFLHCTGYAVNSGSSPHLGQFSPDELAQVKAWIDAGAPEK